MYWAYSVKKVLVFIIRRENSLEMVMFFLFVNTNLLFDNVALGHRASMAVAAPSLHVGYMLMKASGLMGVVRLSSGHPPLSLATLNVDLKHRECYLP